MRLFAAIVLATAFASVQASSLFARQSEPTAEQQQCIESCATTAGTAHPADALSCVESESLTETLQCLCSKDELWAAIEQCISQECPAVSPVLEGLCSGASPVPDATGSVTNINSATESTSVGASASASASASDSASVTSGGASTPVAGTTTDGSSVPSSSPGTNPGDAAVSLRPTAAAVGAVAAVVFLF